MPPRERSGAGGAERAEVAGFPPEVAGALLHLAHERELAEIQRHIDELTEAHRARQLALDRRLATALTGPDAIAEGLGQVRAATRDELRCLVRAGGWRPPADLPYRMVVEVPPTRAGNRAVGGAAGAAGGPTVRWLPELPVSSTWPTTGSGWSRVATWMLRYWSIPACCSTCWVGCSRRSGRGPIRITPAGRRIGGATCRICCWPG